MGKTKITTTTEHYADDNHIDYTSVTESIYEDGALDREETKIRYLSDKVKELEYIDGKSDWIDLYASEDVSLKAGESKLIPLGIAMQLPVGYEAHIAPRSSTHKNFGILMTNSIGIVDETYCGDNDQWYFSAYATRDTQIHAGDRICQFRVMEHQPTMRFVKVDHLDNADRGGFGSTGTR